MKNILLCTSSENILKHWRESLINVYTNLINITSEVGLTKCLESDSDVILVLDRNFFINSKDYIRSILETYPSVSILLMDDCPAYRIGKEFLALGIKGYGNSRLSSIHLIQALGVIDDGKVWLYPDFIQNLIKEVSPSNQEKHIDGLDKLTNKEREIAEYVANGCSNKIIASKSEVTESTVKVHLRSIFNKLHVSDRLSLALLLK